MQAIEQQTFEHKDWINLEFTRTLFTPQYIDHSSKIISLVSANKTIITSQTHPWQYPKKYTNIIYYAEMTNLLEPCYCIGQLLGELY